MAKNIKLLTCLIFFVLEIYAQNVDTTFAIPTVNIQSNRIQETFLESAKSITFISKEDLKTLPVQTIQEAMQYLAGVRLASRGVPHVQSDISIRGGSFDQALILVDGIKLNDAQTGHHIMNIPIPIDQVERIEIIKGPSARIYGPNAYSGVVNIITKDFEEDRLTIDAYGGNLESGGAGIHVQMNSGSLQHQFSATRDFSGGYRYNTDYDLQHYFYKSNLKKGKQEFNFLAAFTSRDFGANGFYADTSFREQEEQIQTSIAAIQHLYHGNAYSIRSNIYWRRNQDLYIFNRKDPDLYRNFHLGNNIGVESHISWINSLGTLGAGIDLRRESLRSTNLGNRDRNALGIALEQKFSFIKHKLSITPGVFLNYYSDHGFNFLPGIDANYRLSDHFSIAAAVGRTFRVPTYTDLYYQDPANRGNPDLMAERAMSQELSIKYAKSKILFQGSLFHRNNLSLIDWRKEGDIWHATNIDGVEFMGTEAQLEFMQVFSGGIFEIDQMSLHYAYLIGRYFEDENIQSRYTFNHHKHRLIGRMRLMLFDKLSISPAISYAIPYDEQLDEFTVIDLSLAYRENDFQIFLESQNLTNISYYGANGVPMPGRWVRAGFTVYFSGANDE